MLQPLADDQPDAAGRGMEQDGLAGLHRIGAADEIFDGHALQHHGGRLAVGDALGQLDGAVGRIEPGLGIGAERPGGIGDAVARLQIGDARPDLLDDPRRLEAEPEGSGIV